MQNGNAVALYKMMIPLKLFTKFNFAIIIYKGNRSIVAGNICVIKILLNAIFLPGKLYREKAYPAIDANVTPIMVTAKVISKLFFIHSKKGFLVKRSI